MIVRVKAGTRQEQTQKDGDVRRNNWCPEAVKMQLSAGIFLSLTRLERFSVSPTFRGPGFICPGRRRAGVTNNMKDDSGVSLRHDSVAVSRHDQKQNTVSQRESSHHSAE